MNEWSGVSGYADFKEAVATAVTDYVRPIRERFLEIRTNTDRLETILGEGAKAAQDRARKTLRKVYKKTGFIPLG